MVKTEIYLVPFSPILNFSFYATNYQLYPYNLLTVIEKVMKQIFEFVSVSIFVCRTDSFLMLGIHSEE